MKQKNMSFHDFLAAEVAKYKGVYVPVKTGFLKRLLVRRVSCRRLHPNPNDEFCMPSVGPNYEIISRYEHEYRIASKRDYMQEYAMEMARDPIVIEKIRPDGYMIHNGHHRWAAAIRTGRRMLWVQIVNLTREEDVAEAMKKSSHDRRVTLDLDEVVFQPEAAGQKPRSLMSRIRKQQLRLGVPALFRFFNTRGYDIWVYTARYASVDDIERVLSRHHVKVCGIVTGAQRKTVNPADRERVEKLVANKYPITVHIDRDTVLRVDGRTKAYEEFPLSGNDADWSRQIMEIVEGWDKR